MSPKSPPTAPQKPVQGDTISLGTDAAKPKIGRPSLFTPEMADLICQRICDGESVRQICRDDHMPHMATVFRWLANDLAFREQYTRAKEAQGEFHAEEILDIADDATNDWMMREGKDGESLGWALNGEHVQRSRLRVDTRKWLLSKLIPKKYGEKIAVDQTSTVTHVHVIDEVALSEMGAEEVAALSQVLGRLMDKSDKPRGPVN